MNNKNLISYLKFNEDSDNDDHHHNNQNGLWNLLLFDSFRIVKQLINVLEDFPSMFQISVPVLFCIVNLCVDYVKLFNLVVNIVSIDDIIYSKSDFLGKGGFSVVYKGTFRSNPVAIKKIDVLGHPDESSFDMKCFRRECAILR